MKTLSFIRWAACTPLLLSAALAHATQEQAVMVFKLPAASRAQAGNPSCGRAVAIGKLLGDGKLHAALVSGDAGTAHVYASTTAVLEQVSPHAGRPDVLIYGNGPSQCESGCIIVPEGARITKMLLGDGSQGASAGMEIDVPRDSNELASHANVDMGDHGYQDLHYRRDDRAVCVTAKNWSAAKPSTQAVRVEFERR